MLRHMVLQLFPFALAVAASRSPSKPTAQGDVPSTIIAMERAALDRSDKGDTEGFLEISAPEVSYFDPFLEQPIRGLAALRAYYRSLPAYEPISGEMSNARVQVSGDLAVLTFNYVSRTSRSAVRWNATEVYRHGADGWRIIHTHWSFLKPQLAQPDSQLQKEPK